MNKCSTLAAALLSSLFISASAIAADKPFATVNGQAIPQNLYDAFLAEQKAQGAPDSPDLKKAIKEELVRRELLAQEAKKKGLDKKSEVQGRLELVKQGVLINAYLSDYVKANPITDDRLKKDYEAIKTQMGSTEYKARHVLVEKEEDAKGIIAKLDKGEKIADLAKQSKDPGSKDTGGDLGWNAPNAYVKPFSDAMTGLKKGEYTKAPVKTDFGYHVIMLDDIRPINPPPFEQVKPQLQQNASRQVIEQLVKDLRSKAKVD